MNRKKTPIVGIDVSKSTFNAHWQGLDKVYKNTKAGWRKLYADAPENAGFAMEATGVYHYRLAAFLHSKKAKVMVLNPLRVRRFMQSLGTKAKTDKRDARLIALFAGSKEAEAREWSPMPPEHARARVIVSLLAGIDKISTATTNISHAVSYVTKDEDLAAVMPGIASVCQEQKKALVNELCDIVARIFPDKFRLLQTIPGIGAKTAAVLLVCAKGMEGFETQRQLTSFVGLAPTVCESGTSVKGRGKVAKTGNPYLRSLLFMCAFSSVAHGNSCADLYARLVAKGKPKMLAIVAVMHRLVKIAFGVVNSGEPYRGRRRTAEKECPK